MVRPHPGEPSFVFKRLQNCVYELCTNADLNIPIYFVQLPNSRRDTIIQAKRGARLHPESRILLAQAVEKLEREMVRKKQE